MPTNRNINSLSGRQNKAVLQNAIAAPALPSTPTLEVYYEDTTNCISVVSGRIATITDLDGDYAFSQGTAANRPVYDGSVLSPNGKVGGYYDDYTNNYGATGANTFIDNTDGQTIAVACGDLTNNTDCIFAKWDGAGNDRRYFLETDGYHVAQNANSVNSNNEAAFTRPTGPFHIIVAQWKPGVHTKVWVDNSLAGTATTPANNPLLNVANCAVKIGRRSDNNNPLSTGKIWSLLVWRTGQFTEAQLEDIYYYLRNRYVN